MLHPQQTHEVNPLLIHARWSFSNDEKVLGDYAWYDKNAYDVGDKYPHQVGLKKPNAFGLYDMHGNVYEWCHDYYEEDYYKQSPAQGPQGPAQGSSRVCGVGRGSSSRVTLVPLSAIGTALLTVTTTSVFGWFVSWISSVIGHPATPAHVFVVPTPPQGCR